MSPVGIGSGQYLGPNENMGSMNVARGALLSADLSPRAPAWYPNHP